MNVLASIKTWKTRHRENKWTYEKEQEYKKLMAEKAAIEVLARVFSSD